MPQASERARVRWQGAVALVLAAFAVGCGISAEDRGPAFVDANGDRAITANELESLLASQVGPGVGAALVLACDAFPRDQRLADLGELRCLERLPVQGGSALPVQDALRRPLVAPQPGWLTLLFIGLGVALLAPAATSRFVRAAGWLFRKRTRGAWFRVPVGFQYFLSLLAGLTVVLLAVPVLLAICVPAVPQWAAWSTFLVSSRWFLLPLAALGVVLAFLQGVRIASASRRLLQLEHVAGHPEPINPPRSRPKNIVICCDGTGNRAGVVHGQPSESNVAKFFDLVLSADRSGWRQSKWYDAGVGTETSSASRRLSLIGKLVAWAGANVPIRVLSVVEKFRTLKELGFGIGITENISQAYHEIVRQYEPGDRIFLVGFSRGAYTARCIADLIDDIGLLRSEHIRFAFDVAQFYRYRRSTADAVSLDPRLMQQGVTIEFLGLWDTVASLGVPLWGWSYSIGGLWSNEGMGVTDIKNCRVVRHALSIDEERSQFLPTLFDEHAGGDTGEGPDIQQRWFRGSHAGVGGGYADSSLSDIPLGWMIEEAEARGLAFVDAWRTRLGRNPLGLIITQLERQRAWRLSGSWPRWHPCTEQSTGFGTLDPTVFERSDHARSLRLDAAAVGSDELLALRPGEQALVRVRGDYTWQRTGIVMEQGARYRITYVGGSWRDKQAAPCGPSGQKATGLDLRRFLGFGKRYVDGRWMELIGHVAHPRPWPQRELGAWNLLKHLLWEDPPELTRTLIPLGQHLTEPGASVDVEVESVAGVFYAFANDWWLFYDNNSGAVMLLVARLEDHVARVDPNYVVEQSGRIARPITAMPPW